ncbi:AIF_collapsed_G0031810.mRNA.1.CDS.1 [Saccharomyces cerevisiae]|nr:AIF_collapsed_G0031810.mRNA.1.CDS.1 [Saccharomyces cerevisiae]
MHDASDLTNLFAILDHRNNGLIHAAYPLNATYHVTCSGTIGFQFRMKATALPVRTVIADDLQIVKFTIATPNKFRNSLYHKANCGKYLSIQSQYS